MTDGPNTAKEFQIPQGSDIAVCDDDNNNEYVFWQTDSGEIKRGMVDPYLTKYEHYDTMPDTVSTSNGSRFAASYVQGSSFLLYQKALSHSTVSTVGLSREGDAEASLNGVVRG